MALLLLLAGIFLGTAGLVVGAYLFVNRDALAEAELLRARLGDVPPPETVRQEILKNEAVSTVPVLDRLLRGRGVTDAVRAQLERAGSSQLPAVFLLMNGVLAVLGLTAGERFGPPGVLCGVLVGGGLPWLWLRHRQSKRLAAFETQFPDALDMLANAMRAGYSFQAATRFLSEEVADPLGPEFGRFYDQQRLGIDVRTALVAMQGRMPSLNLKMFVTAVLIQRETGGNLTELLTNLATLMRDRVALQGHIDTLTAEPKLSGRFLVALPVLLFLVLSAINPAFMAPLRTTDTGRLVLGAAAVSVTFGYVALMKIAHVDT